MTQLEGPWNLLLRRSASDSLFLCWEWVSHWWRIFGKGRSLRFLVARGEGDEVLGIAPLILDGQRRLMFLGQAGETRAEQLDFLVVRGQENEVTPLLCQYVINELAEEWDFLSFERILQTSPNLRLMLRSFNQEPWKARVVRLERSPYIKLGESWAEYLATRKKSFRTQWRNTSRRLHRRGKERLLLAGDDLPFEETFAQLVRLHRKRWGDGEGSFRSEKYLRFHRAFAHELMAKDQLCLLLLTVDDRPVAANYDFVCSGKVWGMQSGWDPDFAHERVGTKVLGEAIRWAIRQRYREYDLLGGTEAYKKRWATDERTMVYLFAARRPSN